MDSLPTVLRPVAQSVVSPNADPGVASLIPTGSHTVMEIDREIISTCHLPHSADSRMVVVSCKRKYVHGHEVLVKRLVMLAQEKRVKLDPHIHGYTGWYINQTNVIVHPKPYIVPYYPQHFTATTTTIPYKIQGLDSFLFLRRITGQ